MVRINDVIEFIRNKLPAYDNVSDDELNKIINLHIKYKTFDIILDNTKIVAIIRYNIKGAVAHILDIAINSDYNLILICKKFIINGLYRFPYFKYIEFNRRYKYPLRKCSFYCIKKLLEKKGI